MCAVSVVGDHWTRKIPGIWPDTIPFPDPVNPPKKIDIDELIRNSEKNKQGPTRTEFEDLKRQVEQMKKELEDARAQDIANGEPDCEMEDKVALLKKVAEFFGVDLTGVFNEVTDKRKTYVSTTIAGSTFQGGEARAINDAGYIPYA